MLDIGGSEPLVGERECITGEAKIPFGFGGLNFSPVK
jgi:hypothetical protein